MVFVLLPQEQYLAADSDDVCWCSDIFILERGRDSSVDLSSASWWGSRCEFQEGFDSSHTNEKGTDYPYSNHVTSTRRADTHMPHNNA